MLYLAQGVSTQDYSHILKGYPLTPGWPAIPGATAAPIHRVRVRAVADPVLDVALIPSSISRELYPFAGFSFGLGGVGREVTAGLEVAGNMPEEREFLKSGRRCFRRRRRRWKRVCCNSRSKKGCRVDLRLEY